MIFDFALDHLANTGFAMFLHCKVTLSPLSILNSLEGSHCAQSICKKWGIIPNIWESSRNQICLYHSLIFQLYVGIRMDSDIYFVAWTVVLHYSLYCPKCSIFGHWKLFPWVPLSLCHVPGDVNLLFFFFFFFSTSWHYKI